MSERGRPPEHVGNDYYTTGEARQILSVARETIINWVRNPEGPLEGDQYYTQAGEPRWRVTKASVRAEAERRPSSRAGR
jgi:hypothetical protein